MITIIIYFLLGAGGGVVEAETTTTNQEHHVTAPISGYIDPCTLDVVECPEEDVKSIIADMSLLYGIDTEKALDIAFCESSFDPKAQNKNSTAKGVYQFIDKTWEHYCTGNVFDATDNVQCFMKLYPKYPQWWECK